MVEGRIEFIPQPFPFDAADVHIWIEDTTYADRAAERRFHLEMPRVSYDAAPEGLPFRLDYDPERSRGRTHTLSVLVDFDGDGRPGRGDWISYQAVRVPEEGEVARVRVRRID